MSCERRTARRNSLSHRLTRTYALLFSVSMLLLSLCVFFVSYRFLVLRQKNVMMDNTELISDLIMEEVAKGAQLSEDEMLSELNTNMEMSMLVRDTDGQLASRAENFSLIVEEIPECLGKTVLYSQSDGTELLCHEEALEDENGCLGTITMVLRMTRETDFLEMLVRLLICINLVGLGASLLAGRIMTGRMLKPIGSMIDRARQIDSSRLDQRLDVPEADDELKRLALTLNEMLDRVEEAFRRQGQFTQDASHELRTPLSVLQGNADLLARWGLENPAVAGKCIATIQRQTEYMHHLVEDLLFLARGDADVRIVSRADLDMELLFAETLEERRSIDPGHVYRGRAAQGLTLSADATLTKQLLFILLDNAAKYTPEGKAIALLADADADGIVLQVRDEGCGVAPEAIDHIFERFYRVDKARARATGGMGLGLSIAQMIVKLHGGTISAESAPGEGLTIRIRIPQAR